MSDGNMDREPTAQSTRTDETSNMIGREEDGACRKYRRLPVDAAGDIAWSKILPIDIAGDAARSRKYRRQITIPMWREVENIDGSTT